MTRAGAGRRGRVRRASWLASLLLAFAGCVHTEPHAPRSGPVCEYSGIEFRADFAAGRLNACRRTAPDRFELTIRPEDEPINPSPWYAFAIESTTSRTLELTLAYDGAEHRYHPKRRTPSGTWHPVRGPVRLEDDGSRAILTVHVPIGRTVLAAQPILTPADAEAWLRGLAAPDALDIVTLGRSAEGRPIVALRSPQSAGGMLVVTGRQHPPEITGALALRNFVERLVANDPLAHRFRERFALLVVPMLNPDGVAHGHWRHDTAGTDLNRDWGPFRRPETRLVRDELAARTRAGAAPALLIDFHSTRRDVLYTQPDDATGALSWFPGAWLRAINARLPGDDIDRSGEHNPGKPTLKTWIHDAYGIPGITFEVGDATPRARIGEMGRIAAETLMTLLLQKEHPPR